MMRIVWVAFVVFYFALGAYCQQIPLTANEKAKLYPTTAIVSRYHNDWTQNHYKKRIKNFMNEPLSYGGIVFVGNSITEKGRDWSVKFNLPNIYNRGVAGDLTDGVLKRLNEIIYYKPIAVFVLIGVNDLYNLHHEEGNGRFKYDKIVPSTDYIGKNILKIAKAINRKSPDTKIYVRTILPTRRDFLNTDILKVNTIIKANENKGYYEVIDLFNEFVDAGGQMKKELTVDGVHLSEEGYEKWVVFEQSIIEDILKTY